MSELLEYENMLRISTKYLKSVKGIVKVGYDLTYEPEDIVAEVWIKMIEDGKEPTEQVFNEYLKKVARQNQNEYAKINPHVYQSQIDRLNKWKKDNPEKIKEYCRINSKIFSERARKWNREHPERVKINRAKWFKNNKNEKWYKEYRSMKNWSLEKKEKYAEYHRKYRSRNTEAYQKASKKNTERMKNNLTDAYVRGILRNEGMVKEDITDDVIQRRREKIIERRRLKKEKKENNEVLVKDMTKHTKIKTGNMKKGEQFKLSPSSKIWTVVRKDGNNVIATMTSVSRLGKKETYIKTFPCSRYMYKITEDAQEKNTTKDKDSSQQS